MTSGMCCALGACGLSCPDCQVLEGLFISEETLRSDWPAGTHTATSTLGANAWLLLNVTLCVWLVKLHWWKSNDSKYSNEVMQQMQMQHHISLQRQRKGHNFRADAEQCGTWLTRVLP